MSEMFHFLRDSSIQKTVNLPVLSMRGRAEMRRANNGAQLFDRPLSRLIPSEFLLSVDRAPVLQTDRTDIRKTPTTKGITVPLSAPEPFTLPLSEIVLVSLPDIKDIYPMTSL
ncbi:hypothetical protein TNCT_356461 [Trichonephila clavata]|uniref:Uncharacterized protein n=1 Tax=Trichonephila clavata TaxID=2740835 RepID=A0A8X6M187_TRICU|nr:hypothetical protein TNCT_356461 [Trichonephila clavata]